MGDIIQKAVDANFTHSSKESFTFSCFNDGSIPYNFDDHELFFDMDVTLPLPWDQVADNIGSLHSPDTQEFQFRMSFSETSSNIPGAVSPADELFYKGQLLPLHLPPRLRMVERLAARKTSEDEESSILLSCYWNSPDAFKAPQKSSSDECETALPLDVLSSSSRPKIGADSRSRESRVSSSEGSWIECTDRSLQDSNTFPNCYRDPALQIIEDEAARDSRFQFSWRKPSLRWRVHMPGSRRSLKVGIEGTPKLRDHHAKEQQKWTVSVFKFRAPASFLKSLFSSGDHQEAGGGKAGAEEAEHQGTYVYYDTERRQAGANEEPSMQPFRHSPMRKANCEEGDGFLDLKLDPKQLGFSSSAAKVDSYKELRLVCKARECLQRYRKLLKPMYVMFSQKSYESENSLSIDRMDTSAGAGGVASAGEAVPAPCSSVRGDHRQVSMEPPGLHHLHQQHLLHKQTHRFPSRRTSFSKRSRGNGSSNNDSGLLRAFSDHHQGTCVETENPIKGAIAHCKQSAQAG